MTASQFEDQEGRALVTGRSVDEPLIRRIEAAISAAAVSRSAVEFDWPECHAKRCSGRHADVDAAFGTMKIQIMRAVRSELMCETTTRPDIHDEEDTPEQAAVYLLAHLMHVYRVSKTSTYVKAAQLIVDAYPALIPALSEAPPPFDPAQPLPPLTDHRPRPEWRTQDKEQPMNEYATIEEDKITAWDTEYGDYVAWGTHSPARARLAVRKYIREVIGEPEANLDEMTPPFHDFENAALYWADPKVIDKEESWDTSEFARHEEGFIPYDGWVPYMVVSQ